MQPPNSQSWHLARSILAQDGAYGLEPEVLQRKAGRVFGQLFQQLAGLFGVTGSLALFTRAAHLVGDEFPFLDPLQLVATPEACCQTLGQALQTVALEQARDGLAALLASYLGVLASFIGDDLVLILARQIWPDLPAAPRQSANGGTPDD